ncbi:hypothetical protein JVT61DRAFT_1676 [Boletus reticuloceps]|uniref:Uncharacterized protein n=1 Tax=Boletus reticuloceps TaxID=495285 RepID=A0A8I3A9C0_9AGAM|nr:hypothetical protein JVT61DRAFT_1676 [Boletus reticuloceps]
MEGEEEEEENSQHSGPSGRLEDSMLPSSGSMMILGGTCADTEVGVSNPLTQAFHASLTHRLSLSSNFFPIHSLIFHTWMMNIWTGTASCKTSFL